MSRRRAGVLLPLELDLLDVLLSAPDQHGFALAQQLTSHGGRKMLAHGTLYKALSRLEKAGLVTSTWEEGDPAQLGRPLRCLYRVTVDGRGALAAARAPVSKTSTARGLATS